MGSINHKIIKNGNNNQNSICTKNSLNEKNTLNTLNEKNN